MKEEINRIKETGELCASIQLASNFIKCGQPLSAHRQLCNISKQIEQSGDDVIPGYRNILVKVRRAAAALQPFVTSFSEIESALDSAKSMQKAMIEDITDGE